MTKRLQNCNVNVLDLFRGSLSKEMNEVKSIFDFAETGPPLLEDSQNEFSLSMSRTQTFSEGTMRGVSVDTEDAMKTISNSQSSGNMSENDF